MSRGRRRMAADSTLSQYGRRTKGDSSIADQVAGPQMPHPLYDWHDGYCEGRTGQNDRNDFDDVGDCT